MDNNPHPYNMILIYSDRREYFFCHFQNSIFLVLLPGFCWITFKNWLFCHQKDQRFSSSLFSVRRIFNFLTFVTLKQQFNKIVSKFHLFWVFYSFKQMINYHIIIRIYIFNTLGIILLPQGGTLKLTYNIICRTHIVDFIIIYW